jgi:hypothetical protein
MRPVTWLWVLLELRRPFGFVHPVQDIGGGQAMQDIARLAANVVDSALEGSAPRKPLPPSTPGNVAIICPVNPVAMFGRPARSSGAGNV